MHKTRIIGFLPSDERIAKSLPALKVTLHRDFISAMSTVPITAHQNGPEAILSFNCFSPHTIGLCHPYSLHSRCIGSLSSIVASIDGAVVTTALYAVFVFVASDIASLSVVGPLAFLGDVWDFPLPGPVPGAGTVSASGRLRPRSLACTCCCS